MWKISEISAYLTLGTSKAPWELQPHHQGTASFPSHLVYTQQPSLSSPASSSTAPTMSCEYLNITVYQSWA